MLIKNGRIIINEDSLEFEVKQLEKTLRKFFENDERFLSMILVCLLSLTMNVGMMRHIIFGMN